MPSGIEAGAKHFILRPGRGLDTGNHTLHVRFTESNSGTTPSGTGAIQRLTVHDESDRSPSWSPDGQRITFHSNRDGNYEVYVMDADGGGTG